MARIISVCSLKLSFSSVALDLRGPSCTATRSPASSPSAVSSDSLRFLLTRTRAAALLHFPPDQWTCPQVPSPSVRPTHFDCGPQCLSSHRVASRPLRPVRAFEVICHVAAAAGLPLRWPPFTGLPSALFSRSFLSRASSLVQPRPLLLRFLHPLIFPSCCSPEHLPCPATGLSAWSCFQGFVF